MQSLKTEAGISQRIRQLASQQELTASSKTAEYHLAGRFVRLWWFGDHWNCIQSPKHGLNDDEALSYLQNWSAK